MDYSIFDFQLALSNFVHIGIAYILSLPVAWEREHESRTAGLRTFPLVAVASCGYILIAHKTFQGDLDAQARGLQALIAGIGFIGGGAILKDGGNVRGIATAASIWNTGAIGAATALGRYEVALILGLMNFATLRLMARFKTQQEEEERSDKK